MTRKYLCLRGRHGIKLKTNKRRLAVTVIIVSLYQTLAHRSFTETAECLVERDEQVRRFFTIALLKRFSAFLEILKSDWLDDVIQ